MYLYLTDFLECRVYRFLKARLSLFLGTLASAVGLFRPAHLGLKEIQLNQKQYTATMNFCGVKFVTMSADACNLQLNTEPLLPAANPQDLLFRSYGTRLHAT